MVFARSSGSTSTTAEEIREGAGKADVSVFPLATPLIAGPGAITLVSLLLASRLRRHLGVTGLHVVGRVFGVLLAALAVQFMFDGIAQSGLLPG